MKFFSLVICVLYAACATPAPSVDHHVHLLGPDAAALLAAAGVGGADAPAQGFAAAELVAPLLSRGSSDTSVH